MSDDKHDKHDESKDKTPVTLEASGTPVSYEPEMKLDAAAIAKVLMEQTGLPAVVKIHREGVPSETAQADIPKPTLESLREKAVRIAASFASNLTKLMVHRKMLREEGATRALLLYHHTGKSDALREFSKWERSGLGPVLVQLRDEHLVELIAANVSDDPKVACGLGVYTGAVLALSGLKMEEIIDCASDPVFVAHALTMRAGPKDVIRLALEVTSEVHQAAALRRQKVAD